MKVWELIFAVKYVGIYVKQTIMLYSALCSHGLRFRDLFPYMSKSFFFFSLHSVKKRKHRLPFRYASLWRRGRKFWSSYFFVFKIVEGKLPLEVECIIYRTCAFIGWCKKGWELGSQLLKDFGVLLVYFFVFV